MRKYDVIVIGGGLLGCFAARNLKRYKLDVALLEKREDICTGISRSNTAIVYSGCDIRPGTTKAAMTVKASHNFRSLCDELGVRYSQCGTLVVSFGKNGSEILQKKLRHGIENGVQGIRELSPGEIMALEPHISDKVQSGLYVPETGTVLPWELCLAAAENAAHNGAEFFFDSEVVRVTRRADGYEIETPNDTFFARAVVNCAGMTADKLHETVLPPVVRIVPSSCDYIMLDTKAASYLSHIICHEPEEKGKGLSLVPTVEGNVLIGSTERPATDFRTTEEGIKKLQSMVAQVMPELPMQHIIRSFGAVRPNPYYVTRDANGEIALSDKGIHDFCIEESPDHSWISFISIKTPGLTCANELGLYAAQRLAATLKAEPEPAFEPHREAPVRLNDMAYDERRQFTRNNAETYSRIICRCRGVSEGEIIEAIHRFPQARTLDAIKRRTGAGNGRCQGGFCTQRVIEIIARELSIAPEDVMKDAKGSYILEQFSEKD